MDMEDMTIGGCLDFIDEYIDMKNPDRDKNQVRQAEQADFDNF
ncbi:hypothetical protein [Sporosarcina contaminans]